MDSRLIKLLTSIAFVFLGVMFFMHPGSITTLLTVALGILALSYAVMFLARYLRSKSILMLVLAIACAIAGGILILQTAVAWKIFDKIFGIVIAIILMVAGGFLIKDSLEKDSTLKFAEIGLGVAVIVIGLITLFKPSLAFLSVLNGLACGAVGGIQIFEFVREGLYFSWVAASLKTFGTLELRIKISNTPTKNCLSGFNQSCCFID